jgi:MYXO-CTERM domain-containing protein
MKLSPTLTFLALLSSSTASAQVLITEVQSNPVGGADVGEWIELHNTSTTAVSLEGWSLNDYAATMPNGEAMTRWTFPALASIGAGQVIIVTRQAAGFFANYNLRATWELADAMDDAMVPNLTAVGGTTAIQLANAATGDAVVLRDAGGNTVDAVEWGTVDRTVSGLPITGVPAEGGSLVRIATMGSSNTDFVVTTAPTPGVGFTGAAGPIISATTVTPGHVRYGDDLTIESSIASTAGLRSVDVYLATATSTLGDSAMDYVSVAMTVTATATYGFTAPVNNLGPGVAPAAPTTFHELFIRYYVQAEDAANAVTTDPADAVETADNAAFRTKNVMPAGPSPIAEVRAQTPDLQPRWLGLSATVRGVAIVRPGILTPNRLDLAIVDGSGAGIRIFNTNATDVEVNPGDVVEAVGRISQFRGVTQLTTDEPVVTKLGQTGAVATATVTIAELLADGEAFESQLVYIENVGFVEGTTSWPGGMGTGGNVSIKDDTGTMNVRITSSTDLFGASAPQYGFNVRGVVGQFAAEASGTTGGYQLAPRSSEDIFAKPAPEVPDAGPRPDSGSTTADSGTGRADSGTVFADAGTGGNPSEDSGCGCTTTSTPADTGLALGAIAMLGLALALRRRA